MVQRKKQKREETSLVDVFCFCDLTPLVEFMDTHLSSPIMFFSYNVCRGGLEGVPRRLCVNECERDGSCPLLNLWAWTHVLSLSLSSLSLFFFPFSSHGKWVVAWEWVEQVGSHGSITYNSSGHFYRSLIKVRNGIMH
jgi:hypothetical protein